MWKLNTLLNSQWVKEEITKEMRKYFVVIKNEDSLLTLKR